MSKLTITRIIAAVLFFLVSGSVTLIHTLSIDPYSMDSDRCVNSTYYKREHVYVGNETSRKDDPFAGLDADGFGPRVDAYVCDSWRFQEIIDLRSHPVASVLGSLVPTILLVPVAFFLSGFVIRRFQARAALARGRFKQCEFCAERIKSEAKVCRYCKRDVSV